MSFLFGGGGQSSAPTQAVSAPARMPTPNSAVARNAASRERNRIFSRSGRSSTILSRRGGEPGTAAYSNSLLGQAG